MPTSMPETPPNAAAIAKTSLVDAVDVDAHLHRGVAILRGGTHRPAKLGIAQEDKQQQGGL